jgi:hypothetical protein
MHSFIYATQKEVNQPEVLAHTDGNNLLRAGFGPTRISRDICSSGAMSAKRTSRFSRTTFQRTSKGRARVELRGVRFELEGRMGDTMDIARSMNVRHSTINRLHNPVYR